MPSHPYDVQDGDQNSLKERLLRGAKDQQMGYFISHAPSVFLSGPSQMFFINNTPSHCYHLRVASFTLLVNEVCSPQGRPFPAVSSSKGTVGVSARPLDTGPSLTHPVFLVTPALPALPCLLCFD